MSWNRACKSKMSIQELNLSRSDISDLIDEWIFSERDRALLKRRLLDGVTYERLSEEFSLSVRHTKTIVYKAENRLFKHLA